jgi:hypothetical protein
MHIYLCTSPTVGGISTMSKAINKCTRQWTEHKCANTNIATVRFLDMFEKFALKLAT